MAIFGNTKHWLIAAHLTRALHVTIKWVNVYACIMILITFPWYIGCLIITLMLSPFVGGDRCILNHVENYCRIRAGREPLVF